MLKKIFLSLAAIIGIGLIALFIFLKTNPLLPENATAILEQVKKEPIPELIHGKTGFAKNGDVSIWYEVQSKIDTPKATVLLIMGYGTTGLNWPDYFCEPFLNAGYQVVRYDNRGVGESDWMENWDSENPYTLEDMGKDAAAILDDLGVDKGHIVGASMGGMIAQSMTINHPERVQSLTSIMSTGYFDDPELTQLSFPTLKAMVKLTLNYGLSQEVDEQLKLRMATGAALEGSGDYEVDAKYAAQKAIYEIKKRKGFNPKAAGQHGAAISASGSRYEQLGQIKVPTLVVHGKNDPLVLFEHGAKSATKIPNAKTLWIEGLGHDIPKIYAPQITKGILNNIKESE